MIIGKSSNLYKELYNNGDLLAEPDLEYEFSKQYAHVLVGGQSKNPEKIYESFKNEIAKLKENGLEDEHFERIKRKLYGDYVTEYNSVANIARMFLADSFKGINSFDYIEKFNTVTKEYAEQILKELFEKYNLEYDDSKIAQIIKFYDMVIETNKVMNLTNITEEKEFALGSGRTTHTKAEVANEAKNAV